ncbi:MAG: preprotein translocase subunit SecA [Armatimonadetes bacterium]|nr:preprotein translocase subunit SecA [Armatimonadota bacterium]
MIQFLRKLFDTSDKDIAAIRPVVDQINALEPKFQEMTDEVIRSTTQNFKTALTNGATLEQILPEVFAAVREASRRTLGMRQFDVQLIGGVVLHNGRISEMKTGEGKTLVAVAPMVLNALSGKGSHLVTVNDYLARRDAVWMGPIYHFLGLTVGVVQGQGEDSDELGGSYVYDPGFEHEDPRYMHLRPCTRREAYLQDITYGTNNEFGFDYLRDNMAFDMEQLSMRELNFAIIDEVDSILVDEARTPHIISGPSMEDVSVYKHIDAIVREMKLEQHYTVDKKNHSASFTEDGMDYLEQALGIENIANDPRMFHHAGAAIKAYGLFDRDKEYVVRQNEVVIVDENTGRMMFGRRFSDGLHQALEAKERVPVQRESQTVAVITFQNLFRMYNKLAGMTGTAKTEEDEFRKIYGLDVVSIPTNRPMLRDDQEDVVYKSMDAKFRGIGRELLRLYAKQQPVLVGTRSIEMTETVSARLQPEALQKLVLADMLLDKYTNEKGFPKAAKKDAEAVFSTSLDELPMAQLKDTMRAAGLPADPHSDDVSSWFLGKHTLKEDENKEHLAEALEHGIPHNVLNAKYHEREALIISEAGRKGAITIATNMAGRGVDILLGGRVEDDLVKLARTQEMEDGGLASEYADTFLSFRRGGKERAAPPLPLDDTERRERAEEVRALGGLYILGTERHESRRIDNQLRGRAGRQGDPGVSRFFVSLEDQLWKIFNAKMLENPVLKAWPDQEEVRAKFISSMILKTQERIENHFFEARKHVLEYDDVLNSQREHIYGMRREVLLGESSRTELKKGVVEVVGEIVHSGWFEDEEGSGYASDEVYEKLNNLFPLIDLVTLSEFEQVEPGEQLVAFATESALKAYDQKVEAYGEEVMSRLEQHVMLRAVNDRWMEHLQMIDYIREGIGLRGYGQVDPLVAYKKETYDLFQHTLKAIRDQAVNMLFQAQIRFEEPVEEAAAEPMAMMRMEDDAPAAIASSGAPAADFDLDKVDWKVVGRNDACPCGSGKKFKSCHYPIVRSMGII